MGVLVVYLVGAGLGYGIGYGVCLLKADKKLKLKSRNGGGSIERAKRAVSH